MMITPHTQLEIWEDKFALKLPFRKLRKLLTSLPCNLQWIHLKANGWLQGSCSVMDLMLYDSETTWELVHEAGLTSTFGAKPLLPVSAFAQQAQDAFGSVTEAERVQSIWCQHRVVLQRGLGLTTAGEHIAQQKSLV